MRGALKTAPYHVSTQIVSTSTSFLLILMKSITNSNGSVDPRNQFTVTYAKREAKKLLNLETALMQHYGYNRSQLHKQLIRERCDMLAIN